jgi:hypothetical protein
MARPTGGTQLTPLAGREWLGALEAVLTATRRDDLKHGTDAAYVAGSVSKECRE